MKNVCVVVVTYNRYHMLKRCLSALTIQTYKASSIIIVDNASQDETRSKVYQEWCSVNDNIKLKCLDKNLGGSGGFKVGMELAFLEKCDWILMMDDDAAPEKQYIEKLIDSSVRNPDTFCFVGSEYIGYSNLREYGGRRRINNPKMLTEIPVDELEYTNNIEFSIDTFTFVGVMISKSIAIKTGLPDDSLFIYYDDTDYSFRIKLYTDIKCVSGAIIHHRTGDDIINKQELSKDWRKFYLLRNDLIIKKRYCKTKYYYYSYLILIILKKMKGVINNLLKRRLSLRQTCYEVKLILNAIFDVNKVECNYYQPD